MRIFLIGIVLLSLIACGDNSEDLAHFEPASDNPGVVAKECTETMDETDQELYKVFIMQYGGTWVDPIKHDMSLKGFDQYLRKSGIIHFTSFDFILVGTKKYAKSCGYDVLLPPKGCWPKAVALGFILEDLRKTIGGPLRLGSWWRPRCYNQIVGGAQESDHIGADAVDILFNNSLQRMKAQKKICNSYWSLYNYRFNLRVGLGDTMMHLGLFSFNGRASWYYTDYTRPKGNLASSCW